MLLDAGIYSESACSAKAGRCGKFSEHIQNIIMNINVPDNWESFIRSQLQSGRYDSLDQVLDEALSLLKQRDLQGKTGKGRVETLLIEGLDSGPSTPMTAGDWDDIEREGQRIIDARKSRKAL